jgi:hypothetical protein
MMKHFEILTMKKCRLVAGAFFLFAGCNISSKENEKDMATKTKIEKFSLPGKWKLSSAAGENRYPLPGFLIFKENDIYSIEGKEGFFHPILDGGSYHYDTASKELRINTSNDAIKKFTLKEKKDAFIIYENGQLIAEYRKPDN